MPWAIRGSMRSSILAQRPRVEVPAILLYRTNDGTAGPPATDTAPDRANFSRLLDR